ncbi:hypothetical protein ABH915_002111 [Arthrobacter sp. MW3 TE3886]
MKLYSMWSLPVRVTSGPGGFVPDASATVTHSFAGGGGAGCSSAFNAATVAVTESR